MPRKGPRSLDFLPVGCKFKANLPRVICAVGYRGPARPSRFACGTLQQLRGRTVSSLSCPGCSSMPSARALHYVL